MHNRRPAVVARGALWIVMAAFAPGCMSPEPLAPEGMNPAHAAAQPSNIPGVRNFAKISDDLYRGEQPTAQGFAELKRMGIKTIVNLRYWHDDREMLRGLDLQCVRLRANAWHIEDEDVAAFLKVVRDPANRPVFVHCLHGSDRTGAIIGSYRMIEQGWSSDEAVAELSGFGFHSMFGNVVRYLRRLSPGEMNARVSETPEPRVERIP